jgi:hypothetical protein
MSLANVAGVGIAALRRSRRQDGTDVANRPLIPPQVATGSSG